MRKYTLILLLLFQSGFALQTITIADNQTKNITISTYELSRIFVKDDRIQNVRGLEGAYILTKDAVLGQIYVKPTPAYQTRAFNLFITTEKAHSFNLFVTAKELSGQDIELKSSTPSKEAEKWEQNSEYSQVLVQLIAGMINNEVPSGYSVVYPDKKTKAVKYDKLSIKLQKRYLGKHLYGEALLVQNKSNNPVNLTENMFYQANVRAITILETAIPANGQTILLRVVGNE